jgi:histidyl-tRNA synthetase
MRDLLPDQMRAFRHIEDAFRRVARHWGYEEIRTPTVESYSLFTSAGALSPEMLAGAYTFLDWDGWSGERVMLRYDSTIPVARAAADAGIEPPSRLLYVQSVFRGAEGEDWQCGLEYLGAPPVVGDLEVLAVAADTFAALDLPVDLRLTHAGVARAAVDAAGLTDVLARRALLDDVAGQGLAAVQGAFVDQPAALAFLQTALGGSGELPLIDNLIALARTGLPGAVAPLEELREVAAALVETGRAAAIDFTLPFDFEYYSGVTWELRGEGGAWGRGGRYQPAGPGAPASACGLALDADRLSERVGGQPSRGAAVAIVAEREAGLARALRLASSLHRHGIPAALGDAPDAAIRLVVGPAGISATSPDSHLEGATLDQVVQFVLQHK